MPNTKFLMIVTLGVLFVSCAHQTPERMRNIASESISGNGTETGNPIGNIVVKKCIAQISDADGITKFEINIVINARERSGFVANIVTDRNNQKKYSTSEVNAVTTDEVRKDLDIYMYDSQLNSSESSIVAVMRHRLRPITGPSLNPGIDLAKIRFAKTYQIAGFYESIRLIEAKDEAGESLGTILTGDVNTPCL